MNPADVQYLFSLSLVISLHVVSICSSSTSQPLKSLRELQHAGLGLEHREIQLGTATCDSISMDPLDEKQQTQNETLDIVVKQDGTGDHTTVQQAVDAVPVASNSSQRVVIHIFPGIYVEKVNISSSKANITLKGEGQPSPIISWNDTAASSGSTGKSSTVNIDADYFIATSIVFKNTAPAPPPGAVGAQAVAVRIAGDMAAFYNCEFWGAQDTLCDMRGRHFFKNCFIQGSIDFIFGDGQSIYTGCRIDVNTTMLGSGTGAVTAQKRGSVDESTGYSFINCTITGTGSESTAYLGRAWGGAARVVFSFSNFSSIIDPRGWNDWGDPSRDGTVYFGEYNNSGPGANLSRRLNYSKVLTADEVQPFLDLSFIDGDDWLDPDLY